LQFKTIKKKTVHVLIEPRHMWKQLVE